MQLFVRSSAGPTLTLTLEADSQVFVSCVHSNDFFESYADYAQGAGVRARAGRQA